ncbi:MAG: hypothetical protein QM518_08950 [Verrucomicrobiota bacterium]|jgi:hypothetical protein|nr:hypothetical protein [Verrucomicrobiota bacterium]
MQKNQKHPNGEGGAALPAGAEERLRRFAQGPVPASDLVDQRVLRLAADRMAAIRRRRIWRRVAVVSGTTAAAAALVLAIRLLPQRQGMLPQPVVVQGDFNGDGAFDVLDAFGMAKSLSQGEQLPVLWDATQDGVIDEADVQEMLRRMVSIHTEDES